MCFVHGYRVRSAAAVGTAWTGPPARRVIAGPIGPPPPLPGVRPGGVVPVRGGGRRGAPRAGPRPRPGVVQAAASWGSSMCRQYEPEGRGGHDSWAKMPAT